MVDGLEVLVLGENKTMEEETLILLGAGALAVFFGYEYFKAPVAVSAVATTSGVVPTGSTSNTLSTPVTTTATPSANSQTTQQVLASNNIAQQGTVASGYSQAELNALINSNVLTALTPAQQAAMSPTQLGQFSTNQHNLLVQQQASLSSGLPSVIPYSQASALLQIPQAVINGMKLGAAVGTPFGTYSLQPSGFVTVDKVDGVMEAQLVAKNQTWAQYNGLSGLRGFLTAR